MLVTVAAAGAVGLVLLAAPGDAQTVPSAAAGASGSGLGAAAEDRSIRPFTVQVPQAALDDLRRRIAATRWPDKETVPDQSQGVPAGPAAGAGPVLGQRLRLAQGGSEAQ